MSHGAGFELSYYTQVLKWDGKSFSFDKKAVEKRLRSISRAGIGWIGLDGINLTEQFSVDLDSVVDTATKLFQQNKLKISSLHYAGPTYADPGESQMQVQDLLAAFVEKFASWKPKSIVVHAGWPLGLNDSSSIVKEYLRQKRKYGVEKIIRVVAGNIDVMAQEAQKRGILIAIENMGRFLPFGGFETLPRLVEAVNRQNVGYCIDSGHAHCFGESVVKWIEIAGNKLHETHFHDNRGLGKRLRGAFIKPTHSLDEHMPPGFGTIAWIDVINALGRIGFDGPATFETGGFPVDDATESYRLAIAWWRSCEKFAEEKRSA